MFQYRVFQQLVVQFLLLFAMALAKQQQRCAPNPCKNGGTCILVSDIPQKATCDAQSTPFGDSCYYFSASPQSWHEAMEHCASVHAELVSVDSQAEQQFLSTFIRQQFDQKPTETASNLDVTFASTGIKNVSNVWTAGRFEVLPSGFGLYWNKRSSVKIPTTEAFWAPDEPNVDAVSSDACISITAQSFYSGWAVQNCDATRNHYVCEKSKNKIETEEDLDQQQDPFVYQCRCMDGFAGLNCELSMDGLNNGGQTSAQQVLCDNQPLMFRCPKVSNSSLKIVVEFAEYGHSNDVTAPPGCASPLNEDRCTADYALALLTERCQGEQECELPLLSSIFHTSPCRPGTLNFLEYRFRCVNEQKQQQKRFCPADSELFSGRCFELFLKEQRQERQTWHDARNKCELKGGSLAGPIGPILHSFFVEKLTQLSSNKVKLYWIGMQTSTGNISDGRWLSGDPVDFRPEGSRSQNGHCAAYFVQPDENYVGTAKVVWITRNCSQLSSWICEYPAIIGGVIAAMQRLQHNANVSKFITSSTSTTSSIDLPFQLKALPVQVSHQSQQSSHDYFNNIMVSSRRVTKHGFLVTPARVSSTYTNPPTDLSRTTTVSTSPTTTTETVETSTFPMVAFIDKENQSTTSHRTKAGTRVLNRLTTEAVSSEESEELLSAEVQDNLVRPKTEYNTDSMTTSSTQQPRSDAGLNPESTLSTFGGHDLSYKFKFKSTSSVTELETAKIEPETHATSKHYPSWHPDSHATTIGGFRTDPTFSSKTTVSEFPHWVALESTSPSTTHHRYPPLEHYISSGYCAAVSFRGIEWPSIQEGVIAHVNCPQGISGIAVWQCQRDADKLAFAPERPDLSGCRHEWLDELFVQIDRKRHAVRVLEDLLHNVQSNSQQLFGGDIDSSVGLLERLLTLQEKQLTIPTRALQPKDKQEECLNFVSVLGSIIDSLLNSSSSEAWDDIPYEMKPRTISRLFASVERAEDLLARNLFQMSQTELKFSDLVLKVFNTQTVSNQHIDTTASAHVDPLDHQNIGFSVDNASILLPDLKKLTIALVSHNSERHSLSTAVHHENAARVTLSIYRNSSLQSLMQTTELPPDTIVNSAIVGASGSNLMLPQGDWVSLRFKHLQINHVTNPRCVFWNATSSGWDHRGCVMESSTSTSTETACLCNHLGHFAVLMDLTVPTSQEFDIHQQVLKWLTRVACGISALCLFMSFGIFVCFRSLWNDQNTIHLNLCVCLLIGELTFLFGIDQTEDKALCTVISSVLHLVFLAAFFWLLIEAYQLYLMLVRVFEVERSRALYYYAVCYSCTITVVAITFGNRQQDYGTKEYCWINVKTETIWALVAPVICVGLVDVICLLVALRVSFNAVIAASSARRASLQRIRRWIRGSAILLILVAATWTSAYLYIVQPETIAFAYLFAVTNCLQGAFIFLFYVVLNDKVTARISRMLKRHSCQCCLLEKYVFSSTIASSLSSSNYAKKGRSGTSQSTVSSSAPVITPSAPFQKTASIGSSAYQFSDYAFADQPAAAAAAAARLITLSETRRHADVAERRCVEHKVNGVVLLGNDENWILQTQEMDREVTPRNGTTKTISGANSTAATAIPYYYENLSERTSMIKQQKQQQKQRHFQDDDYDEEWTLSSAFAAAEDNNRNPRATISTPSPDYSTHSVMDLDDNNVAHIRTSKTKTPYTNSNNGSHHRNSERNGKQKQSSSSVNRNASATATATEEKFIGHF